MLRPLAQTRKKRPRVPVNEVTTGFRVAADLGAVLEPVLPVQRNTQRCGGGKPRPPDRQGAAAIFDVLRTGWQWRALDATECCPHSTAQDRFREGGVAGVCRQLGKAGGEQFEELQGLDWQWLSLEGAMSKAPRGGEKHRAPSPGSGRTGRQTARADRGPWGAPGRGRRGRPSA